MFAVLVVGVMMLIVFLNIVLYQWLHDLVGVPLTLGVFLLVYVVLGCLPWRDRIVMALWPDRAVRYLARPESGPPEPEPEKPLPPVWSLAEFDARSARYERSSQPAEVRAARILRTARQALHEYLVGPQGTEQAVRFGAEEFGKTSVKLSVAKRHSYLFLEEREETESGYPPVRRTYLDTVACTWAVRGPAGSSVVMLTVDADERPQLLLKPVHRRYPGTPAGLRAMIEDLSGKP